MNNDTPTYTIASSYLIDCHGTIQKDGLVEFDSQGTLLRMETGVQNLDSQPHTCYHNGLLIPGMVNTHCHLELSFFQGVIPQQTGLVEFIKQVIGHRNDYTIEQQIESAERHSQFMWLEGVQAVGDISNGTASFAAKCQSQINYHTFGEYFGMPAVADTLKYYNEHTANHAVAAELGLPYSATPHSTYLVSDELFKMGRESERLSIHFMETPSEIDLFDRRGGMYDFIIESGMTPDFLGYGSHSKRLVESLPADIPLLLIHNTQIERQDIERIMNHFRDVTFVLCPRSNYYIEGGYPPAMMLREMGARMALGTDSLSSNTSLSMVEEIKWCSKHNPLIPLEEIIQWATIGGARALGLENELGSFQIGQRCGAVLLTNIDYPTMRLTPETKAERLI